MHWVWYQQCGGGSSGSEWRAALWPVLGLTLPMIKPAEGGRVGTSKWAASTMAAVVAAVAIVVKEEKTMVGVRQYLTIEEEKEDNKSTYSKESDNGDDTTKKKWSANWLLRRWTYCSRESKLRLWCCWGYFSIAVRRPGYLAPLCWWPWWSSTSVPMSLTWPDLLAGINDGSHHRQVCWAHIAGKLLWHTNASGEHWGTTAAGWPFILCQKRFSRHPPEDLFHLCCGRPWCERAWRQHQTDVEFHHFDGSAWSATWPDYPHCAGLWEEEKKQESLYVTLRPSRKATRSTGQCIPTIYKDRASFWTPETNDIVTLWTEASIRLTMIWWDEIPVLLLRRLSQIFLVKTPDEQAKHRHGCGHSHHFGWHRKAAVSNAKWQRQRNTGHPFPAPLEVQGHSYLH